MTYQNICANYYLGFAKLSIWYARKRILEGSSDFENAFNERVNIFRNTSLSQNGLHPTKDVIPEWDALLKKVEQIFVEYIQSDDTSALEQKSLDIFWPVLEESALKAIPYRPTLDERPYESWSRDYHEDVVNIHINNVYKPDSPLSEKRPQFAAALIRLLEDTQELNPEVTKVACGSWLNSVPTFLEIFPGVWKASGQRSKNVRYTLGHWGQFMDRRGDFHASNGARFREMGDFPYPSLHCTDSLEAVLCHLREKFPEAIKHNQAVHNR
tara:strand:+ start:190 stop:996 length:807 start_codon:yes stop_codon:yes gene_type:complete